MSPDLRDALRNAVTAATLTPFDASGNPHVDAVGPYAASLVLDGVGALAVLAHTGRGLHLSDDVRRAVVRTVRDAVDVPLIAGIGLPGYGDDSPSYRRQLFRGPRTAGHTGTVHSGGRRAVAET